MRIISKADSKRALNFAINLLYHMESLPTDAFGNSSDAVDKMAQMYYDVAELAYIVGGIEGLNECISNMSSRTRNIDETLAVSKAHIKVISRTLMKRRKQ